MASKDFNTIKEYCGFFLEFIKHPKTVGAILPSSKLLAREIVREIPKDVAAEKRLILEVGPGTGVFTETILQRMNPHDELHLVEFDPVFAMRLESKYKDISNIKVFQGDILEHELQNGQKYDFVISGLPLNAFQWEFVSSVFTKFTELTKEGGKISYFEYMGIPSLKKLFSSPEKRENLNKILAMKQDFYRKNKLRSAHVIINAPCARVLHHELSL